MNTGTDLDLVALNLDPIITAIGAVATMTLIEVTLDHFTGLPTATSHMTEAPVPTATITYTPPQTLISQEHFQG